MAIDRRRFLAGAAVAAARRLAAQPKVRTGPLICLYSRLLPNLEYSDLGPILSAMGFDGCDLSVEPGGTVEPQQIAVDLVRAIETMEGRGLEVPVVTTNFVSPNDPWARSVLNVCGGSGIPFFRPGYWRVRGTPLAGLQMQLAALASVGRFFKMAMGVPNTAAPDLIARMSPDWVGYDFDPSQATPELALSAALPRLKMVILRDARRENGKWTPCPLGEGLVEWPKFFGALAEARWAGPLTLQSDYPAEDRVAAIRKDLEFARQQLNAAYQKRVEPTSRPPSSAPSAGPSRPGAEWPRG